MSGIEDHNFPAFRAAAVELRARGFDIEDPSEKGIIAGWEWVDYMRYDIVQLLECQGVAVLEGWTKSRGARLEVAVAEGLDMPVRAVQFWTKEDLTCGNTPTAS